MIRPFIDRFGVPDRSGYQPWWVIIAAVGSLVLLSVIGVVVGLALNQTVKQVTDRALHYDVELEDDADSLRIAVLDVRHYHRNLALAGISRGGVQDFENAFAELSEAIREIEALGVHEATAPQPGDLRAQAELYHREFRAAIEQAETDPWAFTQASDLGLVRLEALERAAQVLDALGEELASASLASVEQTASSARYVLLLMLLGLVLVGALLSLAVVRVVVQWRRLYAEQQLATEALAQAVQAKNDFIADASHELRTPLTVLRGNAEVGLELQRDCAHGEILDEIVKESTRMSRLVDDLLFLARSDSTAAPINLEAVSAEPFLTELAARAGVLVRDRGGTFQWRLAGYGDFRIDPERIEQAVLILVDNAAKYSAQPALVTLSCVTGDGSVSIAVADRGPGIPAEDLPRIFDRFYRVDKTRTRRQGGSGLGLAIARAIAEAHGGRIDAASAVGVGTTMTLHLPLADPRAAPGVPLQPTAEVAR